MDEMTYIKRMEDFILRLWIDGEIEDYPIVDVVAEKRGLTDYVKRIRDSHDAFVTKLMEEPKPVINIDDIEFWEDVLWKNSKLRL